MKNINEMYKEALEIMSNLNIEVRPISSVRWNSRLRAIWGRCIRNRRFNTYTIELNPILANDSVSWDDAMDTMIHEVLHAHEKRMCHTGEWKLYARLITMHYPQYNIKRCTNAEEKNIAADMMRHSTSSYKYKIICNGCGAVFNYKRNSRVVQLIRNNSNSCTCRCGSHSFTLYNI